jgi:hypothetical protein
MPDPSEIKVQFLEKSLTTLHNLRDAHDRKASFLLSVSGIIFALSLTKYPEIPYVTLTIFSLISFICCIYAIVLPYRPKTSEGKNIFCWWGVKGKSYDEYFNKIKSDINNPEDLIREYSKEIYSLYYNSLRYKSALNLISSISLMIGFIILPILLYF